MWQCKVPVAWKVLCEYCCAAAALTLQFSEDRPPSVVYVNGLTARSTSPLDVLAGKQELRCPEG